MTAPNYLYCLKRVKDSRLDNGAKVLDYGCGSGAFVQLALDHDVDIYGVDVFYEGSGAKENATDRNLVGSKIFEIQNGVIPFPDNYFSFVVSNQVFEHIESWNGPLQEIKRVLRHDGYFLNMFPSKEVWREGHCGVPFAHWLPHSRKIGLWYLFVFRCLGFGHFKKNKTRYQWADDFSDWLNRFTHYKPYKRVIDQLGQYFHVRHEEVDYMHFRLQRVLDTRVSGMWMTRGIAGGLLAFICRKLSGEVLMLTKRPVTNSNYLI